MSTKTPDAPASVPPQRSCPLCLAIDRTERPLHKHVFLRLDGLHESWRCNHCLSTFNPPRDRQPDPNTFLPA